MPHTTADFAVGATVTIDPARLEGRFEIVDLFKSSASGKAHFARLRDDSGDRKIVIPLDALTIVSPEAKPWDRVRVAPQSWEPEREPYEATVTEVYPPGHEFELMAHVLPVGQTRTNFVAVSSLTVLAHRSETPAPGVAVIDHGDGRFEFPAVMGGDEQC